MSEEKLLAIDTETTGLDRFNGGKPFLLIASNGKNTVVNKKFEKLKPYLKDPTISKIFHNAKFDLGMLREAGIEVAGQIYDTMVMMHLYDPNLPSKSLEYGAKLFLNKKKMTDSVKQWFKDNKIKKENWDYSKVPDKIIIPYAAIDGTLAYELFKFLKPKLIERGLWPLFLQECKLIRVLVDVEERGIKVSTSYFEKLDEQLENEMLDDELAIYNTTTDNNGNVFTFNINSSKQIGRVFSKLNVKVPLTAKGNYCVDEEALKNIKHPLANALLLYRKKEKFKNTFVKSILTKNINGILHCTLNQIGCRHGRFSSSNPNLQNQPKKDPIIRAGFISRNNYFNVYYDYKQMEYRAFAAYTKDPWLISKIKQGADYHQMTADILGVSRSAAKTINFGLIYGMGYEALAKDLGVSVNKAKELKGKLFSKCTTIKDFIKNVENLIRNRGYIYNRYGRRYYIDPQKAYLAINYLIAGCCADMVKQKMIEVWEFLLPYKSNLLLSVHDELVIEIHETELFLIPKIKIIMEDFRHIFSLPFEVDVSIANPNWAEKIDYKEWLKKQEKEEASNEPF